MNGATLASGNFHNQGIIMVLRTFALLCALATSASDWANGPTGIGPLQLGMTKAEVAALPATGIHLASELGPYQPPGTTTVEPKPGEEKSSTTLQTPWQEEPLKTTLTFQDGKLSSIFVSWDDKEHLVKTVADQIAAKFGPPTVSDRTKVERCPSYGGGSEEVRSGSMDYTWKQQQGDKEVRARTGTYTLDDCLARKYDKRSVLSSISIWTVAITPNPF